MMKTFDLTEKELAVAVILTQSALDSCGGHRPSDFENDEHTWVHVNDLMDEGYSDKEAAGFFSSLSDKGFIVDNELGSTNRQPHLADWCIATPAWRWMDTIWDTKPVQSLRKGESSDLSM